MASRWFARGPTCWTSAGNPPAPGDVPTAKGLLPVSVEEETDRVVPVIERLRQETDVPLSIDTTKSAVAEAALKAGACIVNDVSGLRVDGRMAEVAAAAGASVILMHTSGSPADHAVKDGVRRPVRRDQRLPACGGRISRPARGSARSWWIRGSASARLSPTISG